MNNPEGMDSTLPRVELKDPASTEVDLLRDIQRVLLKHPVACQAAFNALLSEGREFAETSEGRKWQQRLVQSSLLQRARLVFDLSTLGLLEEGPANQVPSGYLDALFMVASSGGDADDVLNRLFWSGTDRSPDAESFD
jgi:hypothetical protein